MPRCKSKKKKKNKPKNICGLLKNNDSKVHKRDQTKVTLQIKSVTISSCSAHLHTQGHGARSTCPGIEGKKKKTCACNDVNIRSQLNTLAKCVSWSRAEKWAESALFSLGNFCSLTSVSLPASSGGKVAALLPPRPLPTQNTRFSLSSTATLNTKKNTFVHVRCHQFRAGVPPVGHLFFTSDRRRVNPRRLRPIYQLFSCCSHLTLFLLLFHFCRQLAAAVGGRHTGLRVQCGPFNVLRDNRSEKKKKKKWMYGVQESELQIVILVRIVLEWYAKDVWKVIYGP